MPGSAVEGKDLTRQFVIDNSIKTVLDIGPGEGTYFEALRGLDVAIDGIEVWGPYINKYGLKDKYRNLIVSDIRYFNWNKVGLYDAVILGDVIEHLNDNEISQVLESAYFHAKWVIVSLPIYEYIQGPDHENWYEEHLSLHTDLKFQAILQPYKVVETFIGDVVGVYIFKGFAL